MRPADDIFQKSIDRQIAINQARTPSQRFEALCELLDAARAMAPVGAEAEERRRRAEAARQIDKEQLRVRFRQIIAAQRGNDPAGA
jgi:hypothetical protein